MEDAAMGRSVLAMAAGVWLACATPGSAGPGAAPLVAEAERSDDGDEAAEREAPGEETAGCGRHLSGLLTGQARAAEPGGTLLLGEVQGTQELPAFAGRVVCHLLRAGHPVVLALELPLREQAPLERYLASGGTDEDFRALTAGPFWHRPEQDGRSSQALVDLVERVRELRRTGLPVSLLAFDVEGLQGSEHDRAMAEVLLARRKAEPGASFVVLTGNVHASTEKGVSWDEDFRPLGWHLAEAGVKLRSFDVMHQGGSAWGCRLDPKAKLHCGPYRLSPIVRPWRLNGLNVFALARGRRPPPQFEQLNHAFNQELMRNGEERPFFLHMAPNRFPRGFDGFFYVPSVTPSPPARSPAS